MLGKLRASAKFFTLGLAIGMLFAPEAGSELRERLFTRLKGFVPGSPRRE